MSKPDATSAKSLEEIIASIRKSLAGDGASRSNATARTEPVLPTLPPAGLSEPGDALLTDRLAGALNGAGNGSLRDDDDLADILAHDTGRSPRPAVTKPSDVADDRNSRWFAGHLLSDPSRDGGQDGAPMPGPAREVSSAANRETTELSRPEILRASLPPLFGEAAAAAGTAPADNSAGTGAIRPSLRELAPEPTAKSMAEPSPVRGVTPVAFIPPPPPASAMSLANGAQPVEPASRVSTSAAPASQPPEPPPAFADQAARPAHEAGANPAARTTPAAEPNGVAEPAPAGPGTRTLEQVIAELLEPVIRHWLDNNLQRMVEKVVREEVARLLAAERAAVPKADA
jgi:uncharacterized protein